MLFEEKSKKAAVVQRNDATSENEITVKMLFSFSKKIFPHNKITLA